MRIKARAHFILQFGGEKIVQEDNNETDNWTCTMQIKTYQGW
jgi:hypothetical protein